MKNRKKFISIMAGILAGVMLLTLIMGLLPTHTHAATFRPVGYHCVVILRSRTIPIHKPEKQSQQRLGESPGPLPSAE